MGEIGILCRFYEMERTRKFVYKVSSASEWVKVHCVCKLQRQVCDA